MRYVDDGSFMLENETVNWINPLMLGNDYPDGIIGFTSGQLDVKSGSYVQILRFVDPSDFLYFVDPFFEPREESQDWLFGKMEGGRKMFAPLQVWVNIDEYAKFPRDLFYSERARVLRGDMSKGIRPKSYSDLHKIDEFLWQSVVRKHEGRNRAQIAIELEETLIPVSFWIETNLS